MTPDEQYEANVQHIPADSIARVEEMVGVKLDDTTFVQKAFETIADCAIRHHTALGQELLPRAVMMCSTVFVCGQAAMTNPYPWKESVAQCVLQSHGEMTAVLN